MKILLGFLGLALSASALANPNQYRYESAPNSEIDQYLVIGSSATGTPDALQGLWWLDGNPVPDKVISFASAQFQDIVVDGQVVGHEALLPVYDEGVWSWDFSPQGFAAYTLARTTRLTYRLVFNADYTHGDITPIITAGPLVNRLEIPQTLIASFTMDLVNENEYSRDTLLLGSPSNYRFRRIVDGAGNRLPVAFAEYLESLRVEGPAKALLPVCKTSDGQLPSPCASL